MSTTDRVKLTIEQFKSLLPDKSEIHTFLGGGFTLIGCDASRESVIKQAEEFGSELSGATATAMEHGMVIMDPASPLFVETDMQKLKVFTP